MNKHYKNNNNHVPSRNHLCFGEAISITYSECVSVALVIQHPKHTCPIILTSVSCMAVQYFFPRYLVHGTIVGEKSY
jgi:hypothetical protein